MKVIISNNCHPYCILGSLAKENLSNYQNITQCKECFKIDAMTVIIIISTSLWWHFIKSFCKNFLS